MTITEIRDLLEEAPPNSKIPIPQNIYGYSLVARDSLVRKGQKTYFIVAPTGRDGQWKLTTRTLLLAQEGELDVHLGIG